MILIVETHQSPTKSSASLSFPNVHHFLAPFCYDGKPYRAERTNDFNAGSSDERDLLHKGSRTLCAVPNVQTPNNAIIRLVVQFYEKQPQNETPVTVTPPNHPSHSGRRMAWIVFESSAAL